MSALPDLVYLGAITVAGFRGIGPATTLPLHPGLGLTLVVARNGSGKSSFAEGAEVLLTGTRLRWEGRTKAWKLGWRTLHQAHTASVSAQLLVSRVPRHSCGRCRMTLLYPGLAETEIDKR